MTSQTSQFQRTGLPCTILFVDVCGSTQLYETLGNARAQAIIAKSLAVLSQSATRHLGTIIKTIGDEVMCSFSTARDAAHAAMDMQRSLKLAVAQENMGIRSLEIRVGFHSGPVISHAADVFGDTVNVAARVVAHAKPGQILVAKQTVRKLPRDIAASVRFVGSTQVKGKRDAVDLYEVVWEKENMTQVQDFGAIRAQPVPENLRLVASFGSLAVELSSSRTVLHMGRGPENEFVVPDPLASRVHARIEYRRDRFLLIDQSLNGTYVQMQGAPEVVLRRDEITLEQAGLISLGKSTAAQQQLCVRFKVQRGSGASDRAMLRKRFVR
ncbi:MAG: adenylate/guanylate cyclase domain-containing protein [Hyphomicrobiaceae bacterium]